MTFIHNRLHPVLVLGGEGQLSYALRSVTLPAGFQATFLSHAQCDVSLRSTVKSALDSIAPIAVINASAYSNVDRAEVEEEKATLTNAVGSRILAQLCQECDVPLLHISTDYVFDGKQRFPYTELSEPAPLNAYGRTKLAGDLAIAEYAERYLIFRTSWLYSSRAGNFVTRILDIARGTPELQIVADQVGCPTYAVDLAKAISAVLPRCVDVDIDAQGLFNFSGAGETTWFEFAQAIVTSRKHPLKPPIIRPVTSAMYGAAAVRPSYSSLDCRRVESALGFTMRNWRDSLSDCLARLPD